MQYHHDRFTLCRPIRRTPDGPYLTGRYKHMDITLDIACQSIDRSGRANLSIWPVDPRVRWPQEASSAELVNTPGTNSFSGTWTDGMRDYELQADLLDPIFELDANGGRSSHHYYLAVRLKRITARSAA